MNWLIILLFIFMQGCASTPYSKAPIVNGCLPPSDCSIEHRKDGDYWWKKQLNGTWILYGEQK